MLFRRIKEVSGHFFHQLALVVIKDMGVGMCNNRTNLQNTVNKGIAALVQFFMPQGKPEN